MRKEFAAVVVASLGTLGAYVSPVAVRAEAAAAQTIQPVDLRQQIDPARDRTWSLNREGLSVQHGDRSRKIALALPGWVWAGAAYTCPPDLALGPNGEALITSNVIATLWRVDPETFAVSAHRLALNADDDKDVGFSRLVYSSEHGAYFGASDAHGSLWRINASLTEGEKVALPAPIREACGTAMDARLVGYPANAKTVGRP